MDRFYSSKIKSSWFEERKLEVFGLKSNFFWTSIENFSNSNSLELAFEWLKIWKFITSRFMKKLISIRAYKENFEQCKIRFPSSFLVRNWVNFWIILNYIIDKINFDFSYRSSGVVDINIAMISFFKILESC